jgi:hypothetical protein
MSDKKLKNKIIKNSNWLINHNSEMLELGVDPYILLDVNYNLINLIKNVEQL